jgi:hypothetical protein
VKRTLQVLLAGLMLIIMANVVCAGDVTFTGDARARYIYRKNYEYKTPGGSTSDSKDSRVRININAKASGGAYAKARLRFENQFGSEEWKYTPWVDIGYIGVPFGPTVLEAGLLKSNLTRFFEYDQSVDQAALTWDMFDMSWTAVYRIVDEGQFSSVDIDRIDDHDRVEYGLIAKKRFSDRFNGQAVLFYADDQRDPYAGVEYAKPTDGFFWSLSMNGEVKGMGFETEVAYKDSDRKQSRDETGRVINSGNFSDENGYGGYFEVKYPMGSFVPVLNIGLTFNDYDADNDFGWIMIGNSNNEPTAVVQNVGEGGDWFWIAPSLLYRASEKLSMRANFVYVDIGMDPDSNVDGTVLDFDKLYELSGELIYQISDGADFTWQLGALKPELSDKSVGISEDTIVGSYVRFQIRF